MSLAVLADTGPLYALADPSDQYHVRAGVELRNAEERGYTVAVGPPIICETHTLILRRLGGEYARQWLEEVSDAICAPRQMSPIGQRDRMILVAQVPVWTFDRHFATMRCKIWR